MAVHGIHHVTAVSADIIGNLDFYTAVLGLRLVKKSVNQDDVKAYHLFYADAAGSPGTDLTFFDWPRVSSNVPGAGMVTLTSFRAEGAEALDFWEQRLSEQGLPVDRGVDPLGRGRVQFSDPEGTALEIIDESRLPTQAQPWDAVVPREFALRGIVSVDITSARPGRTHEVLTDVLGFVPVYSRDFEVLEVKTESSAGQIRLFESTGTGLGRVGAGGVHHVAFRVSDDDELRQMMAKVEDAGLQTSGYVDRFWFHSVYFREPGGTLFELATDGPGMHSDEDPSALGETISIPPFLEPRREEIVSALKPLPPPVYSRLTPK
jgi:glyoxalase family protein